MLFSKREEVQSFAVKLLELCCVMSVLQCLQFKQACADFFSSYIVSNKGSSHTGLKSFFTLARFLTSIGIAFTFATSQWKGTVTEVLLTQKKKFFL